MIQFVVAASYPLTALALAGFAALAPRQKLVRTPLRIHGAHYRSDCLEHRPVSLHLAAHNERLRQSPSS